MQRLGFIGTGGMGRPMAANLLKAGFTLTVHDARREATAPLEEKRSLTLLGKSLSRVTWFSPCSLLTKPSTRLPRDRGD